MHLVNASSPRDHVADKKLTYLNRARDTNERSRAYRRDARVHTRPKNKFSRHAAARYQPRVCPYKYCRAPFLRVIHCEGEGSGARGTGRDRERERERTNARRGGRGKSEEGLDSTDEIGERSRLIFFLIRYEPRRRTRPNRRRRIARKRSVARDAHVHARIVLAREEESSLSVGECAKEGK